MKQKKTWVLVANGDIARRFDWPGKQAALVPLQDHTWDAPELYDYADTQGMTHSSVGPSQHRLAPRTEPEDRALDVFARDIAERLATSLQGGEYERLVLVAAPKLMGCLRQHLSNEVRATIWVEIDKDLTQLPLDKLEAALRSHLFS